MKLFIYFFSSILLFSCKAKSTELLTSKKEIEITTNCPENGACKVELFPNCLLVVNSDKFNNIYTTTEKGTKTIFKFTFSRNLDKMMVDGHYIEEIYAEFDNNLPNIEMKDEELKDVKLLFNRMCYCKGSAGFYPIKKGTLKLTKTANKTYNIQLDFKMDEVPQVITSINETLILD